MRLERRVSRALVALVAFFVGAQGVIAYLSLYEQEDRVAEALVLAEARQLAAYAERGDLDGPRAVDLLERGGDLEAWLVRPGGQAVPPTLPAALAALGPGPHLLRDDGRHLHVRVTTTSSGRLVVAYDAARNEAQVRQYGLYLAGMFVLCVAAAWAVARGLARIVVGPLLRLADRLASWAPGVASAAVGGTDEEARLLAAFARVQHQFEDAIAREREFVANLSHEFRAPLAGLRSDLEMLAEAPGLTDGQRVRIARMTSTVDDLAGAIGSARALSHRAPRPGEAVSLAACVDDAWASVRAASAPQTLEFDNRVARDAVRLADRHALLTILRNLLANAAEHASPARCTVVGDARALQVQDDGPGVADQALPFLFERAWRGRRSDTGSAGDAQRGLGLAIARELAELNGWSLAAAPRPGGGLAFTLVFDESRDPAR